MRCYEPVRRTGRSARVLWRALLHASENADSETAIVVRTDQLADWTFGYLIDFARPIAGLTVKKAFRTLALPNGGRIRVFSDRQVNNRPLHAIGISHVLYDT